MTYAKPLPKPTPETQPFWDGCKAQELNMFAIQESMRRLRGEAGERQVKDCTISMTHGVGGMFAAAGSLIWTNEPPK